MFDVVTICAFSSAFFTCRSDAPEGGVALAVGSMEGWAAEVEAEAVAMFASAMVLALARKGRLTPGNVEYWVLDPCILSHLG